MSAVKPRKDRHSASEGGGGACALAQADAVSAAAAAQGFDWPDLDGVRAKLTEELGELTEAIVTGHPGAIEEELGDVLFTLVNLGRHLRCPADAALRAGTARFEARYAAAVEALAAEGLTVATADPAHVEATWRALKPREP